MACSPHKVEDFYTRSRCRPLRCILDGRMSPENVTMNHGSCVGTTLSEYHTQRLLIVTLWDRRLKYDPVLVACEFQFALDDSYHLSKTVLHQCYNQHHNNSRSTDQSCAE